MVGWTRMVGWRERGKDTFKRYLRDKEVSAFSTVLGMCADLEKEVGRWAFASDSL